MPALGPRGHRAEGEQPDQVAVDAELLARGGDQAGQRLGVRRAGGPLGRDDDRRAGLEHGRDPVPGRRAGPGRLRRAPGPRPRRRWSRRAASRGRPRRGSAARPRPRRRGPPRPPRAGPRGPPGRGPRAGCRSRWRSAPGRAARRAATARRAARRGRPRTRPGAPRTARRPARRRATRRRRGGRPRSDTATSPRWRCSDAASVHGPSRPTWSAGAWAASSPRSARASRSWPHHDRPRARSRPGVVDEAPAGRLEVDGQVDEERRRPPDRVGADAAVGELGHEGQVPRAELAEDDVEGVVGPRAGQGPGRTGPGPGRQAHHEPVTTARVTTCRGPAAGRGGRRRRRRRRARRR